MRDRTESGPSNANIRVGLPDDDIVLPADCPDLDVESSDEDNPTRVQRLPLREKKRKAGIVLSLL